MWGSPIALPAPKKSTPGFSEFTPDAIEWQADAIGEILEYDYTLGAHEVLFSGSVGSAKSMPAAHLAVYICMRYAGARGVICRRTQKDLRDTIYTRIKEHLENDPNLIRDQHYWCIDSMCEIRFCNGSRIIARTWHDGDYEKMRSLDLTFAIFEEAIEMNEDDEQFAKETVLRLGRTTHIPVALAIYITNPGDPEHWLYTKFKLDLDEDPDLRFDADVSARPRTLHVYYSLLDDNPFLPGWYGDQVSRGLTKAEADRLRRGRWRSIAAKTIYYEYAKPTHFKEREYEINPALPVGLSWDFNIGDGKPMSVVAFQYDPEADHFHFFDEAVIEGMRTGDSCGEMSEKDWFSPDLSYLIFGDASGKHKDTRNKKTDWDIVKRFFANYDPALTWEYKVPVKNPKIRQRHNDVNAYLRNDLGEVRLSVYKRCKVADKGLRLTKLKPGAVLLEDDSKAYQHVTTAIGYGICSTLRTINEQKQGTVQK